MAESGLSDAERQFSEPLPLSGHGALAMAGIGRRDSLGLMLSISRMPRPCLHASVEMAQILSHEVEVDQFHIGVAQTFGHGARHGARSDRRSTEAFDRYDAQAR